MGAIGWLIVLFDIGLAVDAGRRPASVWAAADRQKAFWVALLALFGLFMAIPYFIGVFPRLVQAGRDMSGSPFEKDPAGPFAKQ